MGNTRTVNKTTRTLKLCVLHCLEPVGSRANFSQTPNSTKDLRLCCSKMFKPHFIPVLTVVHSRIVSK